jgi:transcriptional regulator with XRE-family HTH domain
MTLGNKISKLRKENNYTQEQLADVLGVSRQSISKWESDIAYPETEKLIRLSELFDCSLDYLLKESEESPFSADDQHVTHEMKLHERKSTKSLWGLPLWHIGKNANGIIAVGMKAHGVIAIGLKATGLISIGFLSAGLFSYGMLSFGILAIGVLALGFLSAGCFSIGIFAAGAISFGIISLGAICIGDFSVGALAIGKYAAIGDNARAMIALGDTQATGSLFQKTGDLSTQELLTVKQLLDVNVPAYLSWAKDIFQFFL